MLHRWCSVAAILALLLLPGVVHSQEQDAAARIAAAMQQARASNLPVALLESKVAEGRAKGVPEARIATAVEGRLASVSRAHDVMRRAPGLNPAQLAVGADALEAGVREAVLGTLAMNAPADRRAVAIAVLTQLVRLGEPQEPALAQVRAALQQGPEALQQLPAQAAEAQRRRGPPQDASNASGKGNNGRALGQQMGGAGAPGGGPPPSAPAKGKRPDAGKPGKGNQGNPGKPNNPGKPGKPGNPNPPGKP
ncbi:hypothetical protein BH23GEM3_BH23GEM3_07140 [soil metagenome]